MGKHATGSFELTLTPQADELLGGTSVGRLSIAKHFHGGLVASSRGTMLASRSAVEGSAGYVAIEEVSGQLDGRYGTFVLQHSGTMNRGEAGLDVHVVADSGTGELVGLAGTMSIVNDATGHTYEFDYTISE